MNIRSADAADVDCLARIWFQGWHDAHVSIVPAELTKLRTLESFGPRLRAGLVTFASSPILSAAQSASRCSRTRSCHRLYMAATSRGTGVAAELLADAETGSQRGVAMGWLACAIGNNRAARFYEKNGWRQSGTIINEAETERGPFPLEVWRYEKPLTPGQPAPPWPGRHSTARTA